MIIKLPLPQNLIQTVRTSHAIMEAGFTLSVPLAQIPAYQYLSKFFNVSYTTRPGRVISASQSHSFPSVTIGNVKRPLLFAHEVLDRYKDYWSAQRDIDVLFIGLIPPHRGKALEQWESRATIMETRKGREGVTRYWDEDYIRLLGRSKYILCPDGGFSWTYRFFEAILCGATPIIQRPARCYQGFQYLNWEDNVLEPVDLEANLAFAEKRLTIPTAIIRKNIRSA